MEKIKYTREQLAALETYFEGKPYVDSYEVKQLSQELGVSTKQLRVSIPLCLVKKTVQTNPTRYHDCVLLS